MHISFTWKIVISFAVATLLSALAMCAALAAMYQPQYAIGFIFVVVCSFLLPLALPARGWFGACVLALAAITSLLLVLMLFRAASWDQQNASGPGEYRSGYEAVVLVTSVGQFFSCAGWLGVVLRLVVKPFRRGIVLDRPADGT